MLKGMPRADTQRFGSSVQAHAYHEQTSSFEINYLAGKDKWNLLL